MLCELQDGQLQQLSLMAQIQQTAHPTAIAKPSQIDSILLMLFYPHIYLTNQVEEMKPQLHPVENTKSKTVLDQANTKTCANLQVQTG